MKSALIAAAIALSIGAAAFLISRETQEANQSVGSLCQSYSVGQKIDVDSETKRIESVGLHVASTVAGEAGQDRSMTITASGFEPDVCEVQIRDGSIFSIK